MMTAIKEQVGLLLEEIETARDRAWNAGNMQEQRLWYFAILDVQKLQLRVIQATNAASKSGRKG